MISAYDFEMKQIISMTALYKKSIIMRFKILGNIKWYTYTPLEKVKCYSELKNEAKRICNIRFVTVMSIVIRALGRVPKTSISGWKNYSYKVRYR